jgi:hypothetical protein
LASGKTPTIQQTTAPMMSSAKTVITMVFSMG